MTNPVYPAGDVRSLLASDLVTPKTREVLEQRLAATPAPGMLGDQLLATLRAACARLFPNLPAGIDLAAELDARLASGQGDGWRYDALPPDVEAHQQGLAGLDESAKLLFDASFSALQAGQQDEVLRAVQGSTAPGAIWQRLPGERYFEELLAELTEYAYSHPLSQQQIGYIGMADAHGWQRVGLGEHEPWQAEARQQAAPTLPAPPPARMPPHQRCYAADDEVDALVVGTGAGGAPLLARLAAAGMRVVALEAGRFWNPARDFATDERHQEPLFWRDERLSAGSDPTAFGRNNSGIGVGGSTLHYTAYVPRPQPDDLRLHSSFGLGVDWPLGYDDLAPYYDELERFLGVSGPSPYPWGPPRPAYPLAPLPLNGAAQLMQRGCAALGLRSSPAANAALSGSYYQLGVGWRAACTNRGFCQAGCSVGAKASMDVTFVPLALAHGAELRSECFVTGIETDSSGRVSAVTYWQNGSEQRQRCRNLFLCAGAIETPRLLLLNSLANGSGQVGRNFMAHVGTQVWGQFDAETFPHKGIPGGLISEDTHRPTAADFAGGYLLQSIGVMPVTYAGQVARGRGLWGPQLHSHMAGYNHVAGINILGECLPAPTNYLELSSEYDARGLPKPRVYFSFGENEQRMARHAEALMRAIWDAAGAHDVWTFPRSAHTIGTCRMGRDGEHSVVDADGRSWDVPNLYIADNSIFPSALSVNPALTIMALALRIADRFVERTRRNEHEDSR